MTSEQSPTPLVKLAPEVISGGTYGPKDHSIYEFDLRVPALAEPVHTRMRVADSPSKSSVLSGHVPQHFACGVVPLVLPLLGILVMRCCEVPLDLDHIFGSKSKTYSLFLVS